MRILFASITIFSFIFWFLIGVAFALEPGESIVLDPVTGNYKLTYLDEQEDGSKTLAHATYFPATKIVPAISSKFHSDATGTITYSYSVSSRAQSQQLLDTISFNLSNKITGSQDLPSNIDTTPSEQIAAVFVANKVALTTPSGWDGFISTYQGGTSITWDTINSNGGIPPNGQVNGFGFSSQSLPGVGIARFEGKRDGRNGYGGEGPNPDSDISKQIQALYKNDFVSRNAAVPLISVPTPFDAATLLERIQTHVHSWIGMKLLDPEFSRQLDTSFKGAIDAYRSNQPKAAKPHIKTIQALLKKAYPDLDNEDIVGEETGNNKGAQFKNGMIARLAARVLDFDLRYVLKQVGDE